MEFELPEVPVYIMGVLAFIAPYVIATINALADFGKVGRRVISTVVSLVIAALVLVVYYYMTGVPVPEWPVLVLLFVAVAQASFALFTKGSADKLEDAIAVKRKTAVALIPRKDDGHMIVPAENEGGPTLEEVGGWTEEHFDLEAYINGLPEDAFDHEPETPEGHYTDGHP